MFDRAYANLAIGDAQSFDWVEVTGDHIERFASMSGERHPYHLDEEAAAAGPFGRRVAQGLLTVVLASSGMQQPRDAVAALVGIDRIRFLAPVHIGDSVRLTLEVKRKLSRSTGNVVVFDQRVETADGRLAVTGLITVLMASTNGTDGLGPGD